MRPAPNSASDTATVMTTATVIVRLRRRPVATSPITNFTRTRGPPASSPGHPVDTPRLVADHLPGLQLDDPLAHLVDDRRVVGGHDHRRARAIDPVEQAHDAHAGGRIQVARGLV